MQQYIPNATVLKGSGSAVSTPVAVVQECNECDLCDCVMQSMCVLIAAVHVGQARWCDHALLNSMRLMTFIMCCCRLTCNEPAAPVLSSSELINSIRT